MLQRNKADRTFSDYDNEGYWLLYSSVQSILPPYLGYFLLVYGVPLDHPTHHSTSLLHHKHNPI